MRIFPVKIPGDIVSGNGEGKDPALGISLHHGLGKGPVNHVHFLLKIRVGILLFLSTHNHREVLENRGNEKVHGDVGKWGLESDARGDIDIEHKFLEGLLYVPVIQLVIADERGKEGIKVGNGLGPGCFTLKGIEKIDDLSQG